MVLSLSFAMAALSFPSAVRQFPLPPWTDYPPGHEFLRSFVVHLEFDNWYPRIQDRSAREDSWLVPEETVSVYRRLYPTRPRDIRGDVRHAEALPNCRWRKYPNWIRGIWIHIVEGVNPKEEQTLNSPERFETAFRGIPSSIWKLFKDGNEMMNAVI